MPTRRKREISVSFRLRHDQKHDTRLRALQIRITVEGETASDYCSGICIRPAQWDQKSQKVKGSGPLVTQTNEKLAEVTAQHYEILRRLKERHSNGQGKRPTAQLVRQEFLKPYSTSPTLIGWYRTYLDYLDTLDGTEDGKAEKTLHRAYKVLEDLIRFENPGLKRGEEPKSPYIYDLTTGWGKRFHAWLQIHPDTGKRRMQKDSANKYLAHVRDAINHAIDEGYLTSNVLDKFRPKRGKGKPIYFLEPEHLERLLGLRLLDQAGIVLWWAKLMCLTGLDYIDAVRYARNPHAYHKHNNVGLKIVIERSKPPKNTCEIPLIGQVGELVGGLFSEYPTGPVAPILADINRYLKLIQAAIGFDQKLTSKICRKTAGALLVRENFRIETVSKALGHSSIRTTIEHYFKVTSSVTDYDMERVSRQQQAGTIRLRPNTTPLPFNYQIS